MKLLNRNRIVPVHAFAGVLVGYWILHPVTMIIYQFEFDPPSGSFREVLNSLITRACLSFNFTMLPMGLFFTLLGGSLGLASGFCYRSLREKDILLQKQERELQRNILSLVEEGESETLEFKSSLRWDIGKNTANRELEKPVLKTIAGFMNGRGGTMIIGVGDRGDIIGIEKDYSTLKKKNRDGFEQYLMQSISNRMGTDLCSSVHVMFHLLEGKELCRVYAEPSPRPVYLQNGNETRYYLRTGNATRELNVEEAMHHISTRTARSRHF